MHAKTSLINKRAALACAVILAVLWNVPCPAENQDDNHNGFGGGLGLTFDFSHANNNSSNNSSSKAKKKKSTDDTPAPKKAAPKKDEPNPEKEPPGIAMPKASDDADDCAQLLAKVHEAQKELYEADEKYQAASAAEADAAAKYIQAAKEFSDAIDKMKAAKEAVKKATGKDYDPAAAKWNDSIDVYAKAQIKMEKAGTAWDNATEALKKALDNVHAAGTLFRAWRAEYEKHCGPYDAESNWDKLHGKTVPPDDTWHDDW